MIFLHDNRRLWKKTASVALEKHTANASQTALTKAGLKACFSLIYLGVVLVAISHGIHQRFLYSSQALQRKSVSRRARERHRRQYPMQRRHTLRESQDESRNDGGDPWSDICFDFANIHAVRHGVEKLGL